MSYLELKLLLLAAAVVGAYWLWRYFRGQTVGFARGTFQGEATVPGARMSAVVKRRADGEGYAPVVELQLRFQVAAPLRKPNRTVQPSSRNQQGHLPRRRRVPTQSLSEVL